MEVIQFLIHHRLVREGLRMDSFLPDLMGTFLFMRGAVVRELVKQPVTFLRLDLLQQGSRGESFEVG